MTIMKLVKKKERHANKPNVENNKKKNQWKKQQQQQHQQPPQKYK